MLLKAVDKVFLTVIADLIGNLLNRLPGGSQQIFGLVDAPQNDIFIG